MTKPVKSVLILTIACLVLLGGAFPCNAQWWNKLIGIKKEAQEQEQVQVQEQKQEIERPFEEKEKEKAEEPELEPLGLELRATIVDTMEAPLAVIRDEATGYEAMYQIGDRIKDAVLLEILLSMVIFDRDGKQEVLKIISEQVDGVVEDEDIITMAEDKNIIHKKALVAKYKNLNNILKEVRVLPAISRGRIAGLRIKQLKEDGIINKAGFKEQDIVKKINNYRVGSPRDAIRIYQDITRQLATNPKLNVDVTVERDGKSQTLNYEIVD